MTPETTISRLLSVLTVMTFLIAASTDANAQNPRRGYCVGVAGQGTDMWTQAMSGLRLFTPHRDDCNATTEVFVKVYENTNNVDFGFCIENDERSGGTVQWEDARKACLDDGIRLPEPGEYKYVCDSIAGVNNMTDDWEWVSNFAAQLATDDASPNVGTAVPVGRNAGCNCGSAYYATSINGTISFLVYCGVR